MLWYSLPSALVGIIALLSRADVMKMVAVVGLLLALSEIYRLVRTSGQMTEAALISEEEKKVLLSELQIRRAEAETANLAKTRFLTAASHDLRQPINSVALLLGALQEATPPSAAHLIHRMHTSIQSMDRLLNSILEASTLDSGKVSFSIEPVEINSLLGRIQQQFEPCAQEKNIQLTVSMAHHTVMTDGF
jgi:signal transduction histidine kinase